MLFLPFCLSSFIPRAIKSKGVKLAACMPDASHAGPTPAQFSEGGKSPVTSHDVTVTT